MSSKSKLIKTLKILAWSISQLITLLISCFVIFMIYAMLGIMLPYQEDRSENGDKERFYVRSNGVHTDICFPLESKYYDWWAFFDKEDFPDETFTWVAIGWGDKEFYIHTPTWDDLTFKRTFDSFFISTSGAMHVEMLRREPVVGENCALVEVNSEEYIKLNGYVESSFDLSDDEPKIIGNYSYFGRDRFYDSKNNYHLFDNCNSWTNKGLKLAGVRTASWAILPGTILTYLQRESD